MKGKKTTVEQIIRTLREVEVLQGQCETIQSACRKLSVFVQTFYKWRKEYGFGTMASSLTGRKMAGH